jgi:UDP-N-acetylmuramate dehydrogenase
VELSTGDIREFDNSQCEFEYRYSAFKGDVKGRYFISRIYIMLKKNSTGFNTGYGNLDDRVKQLGKVNLENIRKAVISIRQEKLPDPEVSGNAGSFFKNPVCDQNHFKTLVKDHPDVPFYKMKNDLLKIPAAWLIEKCDWKGKQYGNAAVHHLQSVVLITNGKATGSEVYELSEKIIYSVMKKFGISLEREVVVI